MSTARCGRSRTLPASPTAVAAAVFSKIDFDWSTAAPDEREQMLRERLAAERAYADSE